jgi:hypothetical protein
VKRITLRLLLALRSLILAGQRVVNDLSFDTGDPFALIAILALGALVCAGCGAARVLLWALEPSGG